MHHEEVLLTDFSPEVSLWHLPGPLSKVVCPGLETIIFQTIAAHQALGDFFCLEISCGPPAHTENALIRGSFYQYGDMVTYSCYSGYMLEGHLRSVCLENGTWTTPPTCKGKSFLCTAA